VREEYYSSIRTELDDGSTPFEASFVSDEAYEYRINKPGQLSAGFALNNISNFYLSVSGEYIDYSNLSLDLTTGNSLSYDDDVVIRNQQDELRSFMSFNYKQVINIKSSLGYQFNPDFDIKLGYAYLPAKSKVYESDRNIISGGLSAHITEQIVLDINGQYMFWDDRSILYDYFDYTDNIARTEVVDHQVSTIKILAGVKFLF
jgi:long-subunit fatty acid transport protein